MSDDVTPGAGNPGSPEAQVPPPPPPVVSPDGKFFWDGSDWVPMPGPEPTHPTDPAGPQVAPSPVLPPMNQWQAPAAKQYPRWVPWLGTAAVVVVLTVLGPWLYALISEATDPGSTTQPGESYTCEDLVEEAVRISDEADAAVVKLLDVRSPEVVEDNLASYTVPSGDEDVLALRCEGTGVWTDGTDDRVSLEATVDSEGQTWVYYEPIY